MIFVKKLFQTQNYYFYLPTVMNVSLWVLLNCLPFLLFYLHGGTGRGREVEEEVLIKLEKNTEKLPMAIGGLLGKR